MNKLKNDFDLYIEKAKRSDARQIIEYLNMVGGESDNLLFGLNGFHMSVEQEEIFIDNLSNSKTSALFVGKISEEIVCIGSILAPQKTRIAHQADLAVSVKKKYWNIGIGSALIIKMINFAKENGQTEILHLGVKSDNINAIKLYQKMGFVEIGKHNKFFKINNKFFDEILMDLYL
ncbi:MAG: GNAT family N-acetyltransferase [Lachnospiraceae bacterium]